MSNMRRSSTAALRTSASVFAALGDETRLGLLAKLTTGEPQSISRLTSGTRLTRQAVTKHLRVLQGAGVVRSARIGRENRFALDPKPIVDAQTYLEHVSRQWDTALARLKALVEEE
jgi:DNA-binding transcriptional ArsR family regulator